MQSCKARVRAVKAKTDGLGISFWTGEGGVLQTQAGATLLERRTIAAPKLAPIVASGLAGLLLSS